MRKKLIIIIIFKYYYDQIKFNSKYLNHKFLYNCKLFICKTHFYKKNNSFMHAKKSIINKNCFAIQKY